MNERLKLNIREDINNLFEKYGLNWKKDKVARKVQIITEIIFNLFYEKEEK